MIGWLLAVVLVAGALQPNGVEVIARDSMSNVDQARTRVASTETEWQSLWREHAPDKPLPKVDFTTRRVVGIFLGSRPTPGYEVEIVGTRQEGHTVIVEWAEVRPKQGLLLAQVLTSPALLASIPGTGDQVDFRKVTR